MRPVVVLVGLSLALAGCASQQEIQARMAAAKTAAEAEDHAKCQSYGAQPGTQAYFSCRMQLDAQRQQAAQHAQLLAAQQQAINQQAGYNAMIIGSQMMRGY